MKTRDDIEMLDVAELTPQLLEALVAEAESGPDRREFIVEEVDYSTVVIIEPAGFVTENPASSSGQVVPGTP
jgi:hypothetical protein